MGLEQLNSSTIDELGSWCLKGWWSQEAIGNREGGIHGNPASSHHQRDHHTDTQSVEYLPRESKGLEIKQANLPFSRGRKQGNAKRTMRFPQQRGERSPPSRDERQPLTGIVLTLTLPKIITFSHMKNSLFPLGQNHLNVQEIK